MAITLEGSNRRILMPDGTYLRYDGGGDASSWIRIYGLTIMSGMASINGDTTITFPYSFPNACIVVLASEGSPGGWGEDVTIYGRYTATTTSCTIRGRRKFNGSTAAFGSTGITANWVALGY
jgi:hypothetical protein